MSEPLACPKCGERLGVVASLSKESRVTVIVRPKDGEMLSASNVGGTISDYGELMEKIGDSMGVKTTTLVEQIITHEDGGVEVKFVIVRFDGKAA